MIYRSIMHDDPMDSTIACLDIHEKQVGSINFTRNSNNSTQACIRTLFVQPAYRNQKIGSQLLSLALTQLRNQQVTTVHLDAVGSKHFFLKHGAKELESLESIDPNHLMLDITPMEFNLNHTGVTL